MPNFQCAFAIFSALALLCQASAKTGRRLHQDVLATPPPYTTPPPSGPNVRICLPVEATFAQACDAALKTLDDPVAGLYFQCVAGLTVSGCLTMVNSGIADIAKVPGRGIYEGNAKYGTRPIVNEVFTDDPAMLYKESYVVAAVSPAWCASVDSGSQNPTLLSLAKTTSCFSGYLRDAWFVAVSQLYKSEAMAIVSKDPNIQDDAESVVKYFKDTCAPGYYPYYPRADNGELTSMCSGCKGVCGAANPFYGPQGALDCLASNPDNVVAFTEWPLIPADSGAGFFTPSAGGGGVLPLPPPPPPPGAPVDAASTPPPSPPAKKPGGGKNKDSPSPSPGADGAPTDYASPPPPPPADGAPTDYASPPPPPPADGAPTDYASPPPPPAKKSTNPSKNGKDESPPPPAPEPPARRRRSRTLLQANTTAPAAPADVNYELNALLCMNAGSPAENCRPLSEYATCNLGYVPAQAFVAKPDWADGDIGKAAAQALATAGSGSNPNFMNAAAKSGVPPYWLVTPGTMRLALVDGVSAETYLGNEFLDSMRSVDVVVSGQPSIELNGVTSSGGGMSSTAIIVIVVVSVVVVVGAVTGGLVYYYKKKNKQGWRRYHDAVKEIQRI